VSGGRGRALALVALLALLPVNGCTPTPAAAEVREPKLALVAAGDTIKATIFYKVTGSPDSVRWLFTAPNAPSVIVSRLAPPNATALSAGPVNLLPAPPLAEGASATVSACPTAWKGGSAFVGSCTARVYTRPITPPTVVGDSLTVSSLDIYPKGQFLTAKATSACFALYSQAGAPSQSGWLKAWDATTKDWKPACKSATGTPMIAAYCAAIVMGDSTRVLNPLWNSLPWCSKYNAQVPKNTASLRQQQIAQRVVTWISIRTQGNNGSPQIGWNWEETYQLTMVRDTVTDPLPGLYLVGFLASDSTPGGGAVAYPGAVVHTKVKVLDALGRGVPGVAVTLTPCATCGTVAYSAAPAPPFQVELVERQM
jgi:hypothetical protein